MVPEFYGSPLVFKQTSLGSSLTYYFSVSGLLINLSMWTVVVAAIRKLILKFINGRPKNTWLKRLYKGLIIVLLGFTTLHLLFDIITLGNGFEKRGNYWHIDIEDPNSECESEWKFFGFRF